MCRCLKKTGRAGRMAMDAHHYKSNLILAKNMYFSAKITII